MLYGVLHEQELSPNSEVLVVCSGCTDQTVELAREYAEKDHRVRVFVENERKGKASAVNRILENATGASIVFISADTFPDKGSFARLVSRLSVSNVGIVSGNPVPIESSDSIFSRLVHVLWLYHDHVFKELNDSGLARHASEMFCIRKGIVDKIPSETVNDDAYLALIARKKGWLVKYEPKARVTISGPKTLLDYLRQRRRIIFGHYQIRRLTGESPQYLIHLMPLYPKKTLKLTLWLFNECGISRFLLFMLIELLLNIVAAADFITGKSFSRWSVATSTKTPFR